jgi:hypothetical protein
MAKQKHKDKDSVRTITTPSPYGSHSSMAVDIEKIAEGHNVPKDKIICEDEKGYYVTYKNRIDSGLADPCRFACPLCRFSNLNIVFQDWSVLDKKKK